MRYLLRILLGLVGVYGVICAAMFFTQRSILFHPGSEDVELDVSRVPGASVELLTTPDGEMLKAWWVAPRTSDAAVYLYLHGNAQTLTARDERLAFLAKDGAGVLAISWRGYGGSTGEPSEVGLRTDALTAYEWLVSRVPAQQVIVFGESLGTSMAVELAATQSVAALVLDSPFTSIAAVARKEYPWLPTTLLLREKFDSMAFAPSVRVPVRAMHCAEDPLVSYALGEALINAMTSTDKELIPVPGRCHVPSVIALESALRQLERRFKAQG